MRQVSQNYKSGKILLEDVSSPALQHGGILVRTHFSAVSIGTEGMKVREGKMSLLGKAKARPDQVKKVLDSARQHGVMSTLQKVMNKLDSLTPLGYSISGSVIAVGEGAEAFRVGQRVACAGAGYSNHAEVNFVPRNLAVPIPDSVKIEHAAFATIGSIAMQGFRQGETQLGEFTCVIGLGLIGQLLVRILRAAGVSIVGIDPVAERCRLAESGGARFAARPDESGLVARIVKETSGLGIDCTFITAGGDSNGPVELAVEVARDRGRLVDIGKTKLDLPWNDYYAKELDVRFSRSYGPGRYDRNYEEKGIDYPIGYVRWTERRNMQSFLNLIEDGRVDLGQVITATYPIEQAEAVYQDIATGKETAIGVVFSYPLTADTSSRVLISTKSIARPNTTKRLSVGVIGAGNYASSVLLPILSADKRVELQEVVTRTGLSGRNAAKKFGFTHTSTDYTQLLSQDAIDTVLIATRHDSHAQITSEALRAGKCVYVEKPLAIDIDGLRLVCSAIQEAENCRLMVGFNRRFSPMIRKTAAHFKGITAPLVMTYRVHAGPIDSGSWYSDVAQHGSRFIGEAGHFLDVFEFLTNARAEYVAAHTLRPTNITQDDLENIALTVQYSDGSLGNLLYLTQGAPGVPKEWLEVFGDGKTVQMQNFAQLYAFEGGKRRRTKAVTIDKGQREEMDQFVTAAMTGDEMPINVNSLLETTATILAAAKSLRTNTVVSVLDVTNEMFESG